MFQHGDYHIGNMLLTASRSIATIDVNRMGIGDPWEEFNRIVFCSHASPYFASGRIHGYFDHQVPADFFKLLALYIACNTLSSIAWSKTINAHEIKTMMKQGNRVLEDYQWMKNIIPKWYIPAYNK